MRKNWKEADVLWKDFRNDILWRGFLVTWKLTGVAGRLSGAIIAVEELAIFRCEDDSQGLGINSNEGGTSLALTCYDTKLYR